jgi:hypothetical protein
LAQRLKPKNSQNLPEKTPFSCIPRQNLQMLLNIYWRKEDILLIGCSSQIG